jgi:hypothetical protein
MNNTFSKSNALRTAKANATYFGHPYSVVLGSDLKWRANAVPRDTALAFALVLPDGRVIESAAETTVGELKQRLEVA